MNCDDSIKNIISYETTIFPKIYNFEYRTKKDTNLREKRKSKNKAKMDINCERFCSNTFFI